MEQPLLSPPPAETPPLLLAPPKKSRGKSLAILIIVALAIAAIGIFVRIKDASALRKHTREDAVTDVTVVKAPKAPPTNEVTLPGTIQAWHEAPIYARTNGYLKYWKTDIGAHVNAGDVLAEIESPEVDAQLHQSEADLATAKANNDLAQSTARRWEALLKTSSVSKQEADEKISAAAAQYAAVLSAQAAVDRLQKLQSFEMVTAPFDGVITARNTDTGALINAGSGGTGLELFHIVDLHKLRIYTQVPENYVPNITPDLVADLYLPSHPGQVYQVKFAESAQAIDPTARTLLVELDYDNAQNTLMPGGYAEVHIHVPSNADTVRLPVNTLLFRAEGLQVATVDANNHVVLKAVKISRDFGNEVEIQSGIAPDESIIINPPDSVENGQQVRIVTPKDNTENENNGRPNDKDKDKNSKKSGSDTSGMSNKKSDNSGKSDSSGKGGSDSASSNTKDSNSSTASGGNKKSSSGASDSDVSEGNQSDDRSGKESSNDSKGGADKKNTDQP